MNTKILLTILQKFDSESFVFLSSDAEGNSFGTFDTLETGYYVPETTWRGTIYDKEDLKEYGYSEKDCKPSITFYPLSFNENRKPKKVGQLIDELSKFEGVFEAILSSDEEGNSFSPLSEVVNCISWVDGDEVSMCQYEEDIKNYFGEDYEDITLPISIFLFPVN